MTELARRLGTLDATAIVPGQGPLFRDQAYLRLTIELFSEILRQVHAAMESGTTLLADVQAKVNVDAIGRRYPGEWPNPRFASLVSALVRKAHQEALDGVSR